jgi:hypothetical protein
VDSAIAGDVVEVMISSGEGNGYLWERELVSAVPPYNNPVVFQPPSIICKPYWKEMIVLRKSDTV